MLTGKEQMLLDAMEPRAASAVGFRAGRLGPNNKRKRDMPTFSNAKVCLRGSLRSVHCLYHTGPTLASIARNFPIQGPKLPPAGARRKVAERRPRAQRTAQRGGTSRDRAPPWQLAAGAILYIVAEPSRPWQGGRSSWDDGFFLR